MQSEKDKMGVVETCVYWKHAYAAAKMTSGSFNVPLENGSGKLSFHYFAS